MHQHRCIDPVRSIGYQQFDGRFISPVRIVKLYFLFIQADCTDLIRMGKGIVLGIGSYFTVESKVNGSGRGIAIHTDFLVEPADGLSVEDGSHFALAAGGNRIFGPFRFRTTARSGDIRNDQRLVAVVRKMIGYGTGVRQRT